MEHSIWYGKQNFCGLDWNLKKTVRCFFFVCFGLRPFQPLKNQTSRLALSCASWLSCWSCSFSNSFGEFAKATRPSHVRAVRLTIATKGLSVIPTGKWASFVLRIYQAFPLSYPTLPTSPLCKNGIATTDTWFIQLAVLRFRKYPKYFVSFEVERVVRAIASLCHSNLIGTIGRFKAGLLELYPRLWRWISWVSCN